MTLLSTGQLYGLAGGGGGGGADPYFANVVLLAGFESGLVDESNSAHTLTAVNGASVDTAQPKFGASSLKLVEASSQWVSIQDSADWHFATGNFTVECFVYPNTLTGSPNRIFSQWGASQAWALYHSGSGVLRWAVNGSVEITTSSGAVVTGAWQHVAVDFDGSKYRVYVGGVMVGSSTNLVDISDASVVLAIGNFSVTQFQGWDGWIDEVRITKNVARYASDGGFTPPAAAFPRS